jgi:drug/metabolite transporter (DMT)-like permease
LLDTISLKKAYFGAIFALAFWGTTFAIGKLVVPDPLDPFTFTAIRTVFGFFSLFAYLAITHQIGPWILIVKQYWKKLVLLGAIGYALSYVLQYWGISHTTATNQSIISNTQTFWVVFLNFLVFKRKPKAIFMVGAILAFFGVTLVIFDGGWTLSNTTLFGDIISLAAFLCWGIYTAFTKPLTSKEHPLLITTGIIFFAMIFIVPLSLGLGGWNRMVLLTPEQWGIMVYLGVFCVGFAFLMWGIALSDPTVNSEYIAIFTILNPIIAIITAIILLGEVITLQIFIGIIIVLSGLLIAEYHPPNKKSNSSKEQI